MASLLNLRLWAPTKYPAGSSSSPPKSPADDLIERQRASGAAWHLKQVENELDAVAFPGPNGNGRSPDRGGAARRDPSRIPGIYERPPGQSNLLAGSSVAGGGRNPPPVPPRQRTESSDRLAMPTAHAVPPRPQSWDASSSTNRYAHPISDRYGYEAGHRPPLPPKPYDAGASARPPPGASRPQSSEPASWKNQPTAWNGGLDARSSPNYRPPLHSASSSSAGSAIPPSQRPRPPIETRPYSDPASLPSSSSSHSLNKPTSTPSTPQSRPHAPVPSKGSKSTPTAGSPWSDKTPAEKYQCHGTTQQGRRCKKRAVVLTSSSSPGGATPTKGGAKAKGTGGRNAGPAMTTKAVDRLGKKLPEGEELPKFCRQHADQAMGQKGIWVNNHYIEFDDWIDAALPTLTKIHLRLELAKEPSATDPTQMGYIYVHEMAPSSGPSSSGTTYIKLGRSVKPVSRLSQWTAQCPSRTPVVRGFFPQPSEGAQRGRPDESYLRGAQTVAAEGGPFHIRWERLCLLELAGWEEIERYERRTKPSSFVDDEGSGSSSSDDDIDVDSDDEPAPRRKKGGVRRGRANRKCRDCGTTHVELFEFSAGAYDRRVKEVVLRWERWCREVLAA